MFHSDPLYYIILYPTFRLIKEACSCRALAVIASHSTSHSTSRRPYSLSQHVCSAFNFQDSLRKEMRGRKIQKSKCSKVACVYFDSQTEGYQETNPPSGEGNQFM